MFMKSDPSILYFKIDFKTDRYFRDKKKNFNIEIK